MAIRDLITQQYKMPTAEEMGQEAFEPSPELLAEAQQAVAEGRGEEEPAELGVGTYQDLVNEWGPVDTSAGNLINQYQPTGIGKLLAQRGRNWQGGAASPLMSFAGTIMDAMEQKRAMENKNIVSFAKKQLMGKVNKIYAKLVDGNPENDEKTILELRKLASNAYYQFNTDFGLNKILDGFVAGRQKQAALESANQKAALNAQIRVDLENQKIALQREKMEYIKERAAKLSPKEALREYNALATGWGISEDIKSWAAEQARAILAENPTLEKTKPVQSGKNDQDQVKAEILGLKQDNILPAQIKAWLEEAGIDPTLYKEEIGE